MAPTVRSAVSLQALNSFRVEARARLLIEVTERAELPAAVAMLREYPPALVLGGGSNLLFTRDPPMPVLRIGLSGRRVLGEHGDEVVVEAAAGENWHSFVLWTLGLGLSGLENLSLIPGNVGASPMQNIGAYGVELRDCFDSLDAMSLRDGTMRRFDAQECRFGYRDSVFRHAEGSGWAILAVRCRLSRVPRLKLDYGEIREELGRLRITSPTSSDVSSAVCAIRRRKLPDPATIGNAGSFFRNPVVDARFAEALALRHPEMPMYRSAGASHESTNDPPVKLSAGWLIERCGWKGHREADAGVHHGHALVLVNYGSASGAQIAALATRIRDSVRQRFGVDLEPEPSIV